MGEPPSPDKAERKYIPTEEYSIEKAPLTEPPSPDIVEKKWLPGYDQEIAPLPKSNVVLKDIDTVHKLSQEGDYTTGIKQALNLESKVKRLEQGSIVEESEQNSPPITKKSQSIKNNSSIVVSKDKIKDSPSKNDIVETDDEGKANPSMMKNDSMAKNNSNVMKSAKMDNNSNVMKNDSKKI